MRDLRETLLNADTGSDELLDAVERSIDTGMPAEDFDALMEQHWKLVAGEPDLRRLGAGEFFIDGRTLGHAGPKRIDRNYLTSMPSVAEDRHFGKPGVNKKLDAA
jgi:hypothetical protein